MALKEGHAFTNVWHQYYVCAAATLIALSLGLTTGWTAPALAKLASKDSPLQSGPLTSEQISWIGSMNCLGCLIGSMVFGYIISLLGSKRTMLLAAVPSALHWLLIYFGNHYLYIVVAKFFDGSVAGGSASALLIFISEIVNDDIRGRLGSLSPLIRNIGVLIAYVLGATVDYKYIPCICVIVPIVFVIAFSTFSNSPMYYLQKGKLNKAESSLKYYKGYKGVDVHEDKALSDEFERLKSVAKIRKTQEKLKFSDLCNREAIKGLGTGSMLAVFSQFPASVPFICYSVLIFKTAGTSFDPYLSSIIFAVSQMLGSFMPTYVADVFGRKLTNLISLSGSAIGLLTLSGYQYLKISGYDLSAYAWLPVACLSFVIFISSAGILPLAFVCSLECIPPKIRTFGISMVTVCLSIVGFISVKTFPLTMDALGLHGCLLIYGIGCIIGTIFVAFVQKETNGQSIDEHVETNDKISYDKDNHRLISEQGV